MALPNITFNYGTGGIGTPLAGQDYISAMMFVNSSLPSGFDSSHRIKKLFGVQDAENLGIKLDYADETLSTATVLVTNKGAAGDIVTLKYTGIDGVAVTLCDYTLVTADVSSTTTAASGVTAAINALTNIHGFSASSNTATITITCKKGEGVFPNSGTPYALTVVGTFAGTLTQNVVTGVGSKRAVERYHINEYFRLNPKGVLYVAYYASFDTTNVALVRDYANGEIRQLGFMHDFSTAFSTSHVTSLQTQGTNAETLKKPFSIIYCPEISGTASLSSLSDLSGLSSKNVSVCIAQDGYSIDNNGKISSGLGYKLFKSVGKSIGTLGAVLGAVSLSSVSDSIAWVGKFNMSDGTELDSLAFSNGVQYNGLSDSLLTTLMNYDWLFMRKVIGYTGTFNTPPVTCTLTTSDYHTIYRNRTIDKAVRGVNTSMAPNLSSPITLNSDGTLTNAIVEYFKSQASVNLNQMVRDTELSAFEVLIDASQNVLQTNTLVVTVKLLPIGVADYIVVNIGYTTKL